MNTLLNTEMCSMGVINFLIDLSRYLFLSVITVLREAFRKKGLSYGNLPVSVPNIYIPEINSTLGTGLPLGRASIISGALPGHHRL